MTVKEFLEGLNPQERQMLIGGGIVLAVILFWALIWSPLHSSVAELRQRVDEKQATVNWLQSAAAEAKSLQTSQKRGGGPSRAGRSLLALVDETARSSKLAPPILNRVEPKGADEVRVRLEGAAFDDMVAWLGQLQQNFGVVIDSLSVDRQAGPGRVNASLSLKDGAP